jgi:uncharacterized protein with HEPN domain
MSRLDDHRLADIREACERIVLLTARGRKAFDDDLAIQLALERLLEVIGEAANALSTEARNAYPTVAWRDITRLRIVLAHHYHRIDPEQIWIFANVHIPELVAELGGQ